MDTDGTIDQTAIATLEHFDGSAANTGIAASSMPTGSVTLAFKVPIEPDAAEDP